MAATSSSTVPPQHQVFINFRGKDLRLGFVSHLVGAMKRNSINVFMDEFEDRGKHLDALLKRIEGSRVALAIFSENYTDSNWCLKEAEKMYDCMEEGNLVVIPIFYKVEPSTVRYLKGDFGNKLCILAKDDEKKKKWEEVLKSIPNLFGITVDDRSDEGQKINDIVKAVNTVLLNISEMRSQHVSADPSETSDAGTVSQGEKHKTFGVKQRLKELEDKLDCVKYKGTRIIGVVGMPGIGKSTLMKELFKKWERKFIRTALVENIRAKSKDPGLDSLPTFLLEDLLALEDPPTDDVDDPYEMYKGQLLRCKVLVILDDVSKREQIDALLGKRDWIREGSRIVIATSDTSLTNGLVDDTYVVQNLDHKHSLKLFRHLAFGDDQANPPKEDFVKLSEEFAHYTRGHPLALRVLGRELNKKDIDHWKSKLKELAQNPNPNIGSFLQLSYDELTPEQKNAFLDVACFRSQDVHYVESLLASSAGALEDLTKKCLINTRDGRVEMHDLLYTFSRELDPKASTQNGTQYRRLWRGKDIIKGGVINVLQNKMVPKNVRGIFLDMSEVKGEMCLDRNHFKKMVNLRYLKFYNSHCPQDCKTNNMINIPDELELPLKEVRCLHWLKFPLEKLPNDFNPINLVDLKLPYSEIQRLWESDKDISFLKWVDLNHSSKLSTLSGLSKARKLQRLNLEGCKALDILSGDIEEMESLAFMNLKGCTSLKSLPEMNLISLKSLILSGCSSLDTFPLISENLETLYLDGTVISRFPTDMVKLKRLVLLNMKDCILLETIPDFVGELKALQELILSGCTNLKGFPETGMSSLKFLFLDGTAIEEMPLLPLLQYLCLSRNDKISCLPDEINQLSRLKWLDLKYCTSLTSLPEFPPNLEFLDAHGCSSLKSVAKPLARIMPNEQNHSTFIFTNCVNLEQTAKEEITLYAQRKCQLLSDAHNRYKGGLVSEAFFSTCYPGCEMPSWFCHEAVGSVLEVKLPPHWHGKRLAGIAICAVVSFRDCQNQINSFSVKCMFKLEIEEKAWIPFTCPVGSWTRQGGKYDKIEPYHVFIGYTSSPPSINCIEDEKSDKCNLSKASLEFSVTGDANEIAKYKVLRCGLSLVYEKYDLPVEKSFQETSEGIDGEARSDDGRPKKKQKNQEGIIISSFI